MNLKLSAAGFAIQSAKGAPEAQPDYWGPVGGGKLVDFALEQVEDELTSAEVGGIGEFRESAAVAADYESRMWPGSIAGLLYSVLGDVDTSGGAPAVPAVYTTALAGVNNDLTFLAKTAGTAGNGITVELSDPAGNDQVLDITVVALAIEVSLATGPLGAITSTAKQVRDALNADTDAKALITASVAPGNTGNGVVTVLTATHLAGGAAAGGGGAYTHVIEPAATLPWCTVFGKKDTSYKAAEDCKLDELKIEWEGNAPVKVRPTWAGIDADWAPATNNPGLDESLLEYLKGIDLSATTEIDLDGTNYDGGAKILGGSLDIKRNLAGDIYSGNLLNGDVYEGDLEIDVELKVRVPDLLPVRALLTGAVGGTSISGAVPYGEFSIVFAEAAVSVTLQATRVAWKTSEPEASPAGGPAELTLSGRCYGNPAFTATVVNAVASY
jgi:hypothetical protein